MVSFGRVQNSRLYQSDSNVAGASWWGFQISPSATPGTNPIPLDVALNDSSLDGTFVYAATRPSLGSSSDVEAFIGKIDDILSKIIPTRAIIFLSSGEINQIPNSSTITVPLVPAGGTVRNNPIPDVILTGVPGVTAQLHTSTLTTNDSGDGLIFTGSTTPALTLGGLLPADTTQPDNLATLYFAGDTQGTFSFSIFIARQALNGTLNWGFQAIVPKPMAALNDPFPYLSSWLPLADGALPSPTDMLGFVAQINLVNPNNLINASRTVFLFTGTNANGSSETKTKLVSFYTTTFGKTVTLYPVVDSANGQRPAGLVINPYAVKTPLQNGYRFSPVGDFVLAVADAQVGVPALLLCGLSGTETIAFLPLVEGQYGGNRLRFVGNQPAYAPQFPLQPASPIGPPIDPKAMLLDKTFATSWATVVPPPNDSAQPHYSAAPKGADPFGLDKVINPVENGLLGLMDPGVALPQSGDLSFPLLPYAGFQAGTGDQDMDSSEIEQVERQIISPTRRNEIAKGEATLSASRHMSLGLLTSDSTDCPYNTTTPAGFIARVGCDGSWSQLLLAQIMESGLVHQQMGFTKLQPELQAAFQTDNLFLVVANATHLGKMTSGTFMPPAKQTVEDENEFFNTINIGDWNFKARVGQESDYSDYRNVMIVKGVKGKLTDLVVSPDKWTMKDVFAAPSVKLPDGSISAPDLAQLIPLSNWLNGYFQEAIEKKDNPFFSNFAQIIQNETWTGVLLLRVDIADIPKDLAGITAGVTDPAAFYAHHIGIEISQINGQKIEQKDSSSLFGLVYYVDPNYDDSIPPHPQPLRDQSAEYEFSLLTLKALFQNTAVKKFDSLAQIVLNKVFGSPVDKMGEGGNIYNAVLLQGAFQKNGDAAVYSLSSSTTNTYLLANNVLTLVEIDTANMSTRDDGSTSGRVVSWIAMSGYMKFAVITDTNEPDFDIFSFGAEKITPPDELRRGLNFSNLGLQISFKKPTDEEEAVAQEISLVEGELSFNIAASTPRATSLYRNFQLELLSLQSGDAKSSPSSLNYITVATPYGLQGVEGGAWHGLRFKLNLGTPGALASKINLSSSLLVAWADESGDQSSGYKAVVGIELPGAGSKGDLFSLQTVIKLSIGVVQLFYNEQQQSFLLLLNEIALKLLGLLKIPPNGATAFFLFGNPKASDPTGLGWFAIYNQDQPKPPTPELLVDAKTPPQQ